MENQTTTVDDLNLSPETLEYLAEFQRDRPTLINDLIKIGDIIISKALEWGETDFTSNISPEMEALSTLKYFRDFLETIQYKPDELS